jgi:hypothetical protein
MEMKSKLFLIARLLSRAPQVLTTLLVFSLSSGVLGGILFYIDSVGPDVLNDMMEDVPIHMQVHLSHNFYSQNETTIEDIEAIVADQESVLSTEVISVIDSWFEDPETYYYRRNTFLGVEQSFFEKFPNALEISLNVPPLTENSCYIENSEFINLGLEIGDSYTAKITTYNETDWRPIELNKTFEIIGTFSSNIFMEEYWEGPAETTLRMIVSRTSLNTYFDELGHGRYDGIQDQIWTVFDTSIVTRGDPILAQETLGNVRKRIEQRTVPYASVVNFGLYYSVINYASWSSSMTAIALAFSIPSIIMGIMLVYYNSNLLADERRRDIGTLKTRGASGWQAFNWVISSAIITGFLGSLGAVLTGTLATLLSGSVRELLVFDLEQLSGFNILLYPEALLYVFLFSFIIGLIVALPGAVRALLMTPTEAHSILEKRVLSEAEQLGSPAIDIVAVAISGYLLMPLIMFMVIFSMYGYGISSFSLIIVPLLGIFIVGLARLMSRPTSNIKARILGWVKRPSLITGTRVMGRTVLLFKKSEAMGVMFVSMVFAAGVFASISATTGSNHMKELFMFDTGADIAIDVDPALQNVTLDFIDNITRVEGVDDASAVLAFQSWVEYWTSSRWEGRSFVNTTFRYYGVQAEKWAQTAFWLDYFTLDFLPSHALSLLAESNSSVLSSFKPVLRYELGAFGQQTPVYYDEITTRIVGPEWRNITDCIIVDVLADSEEGYSTFLPGESDASNFVVVNLDYAHACLNTSKVNKFYIKLEPGANYTQVMIDLWDLAPYSFESVESPFVYIDEVLESRTGQTIYGVYTLNVLFSIIYLTAGVTIVAMVRTRNLQRQLSVLRALGTEKKDIISSVLLDTIIGLFVSSLIGSLIGLMLTALMLAVPLVYIGSTVTINWSRLPVLLAVPVPLLIGIVGCSLLFSLLTTYVVTERSLRGNIAEQIAVE